LKRQARLAAKAVMAGCDPGLGQIVARRILEAKLVPAKAVVAGFLPLGREIDMAPLLRSLREAGHSVALPRTPARGFPLSFRRWDAGDALRPEAFGTMTSDGPEIDPDLLLVPMLAFDRRGYRLGYGGGYYDRTLAARPGIRTIGCAYAALEVPELPTDPNDRTLEVIVTEREIIPIVR
jgi:5-formyltetrahydrofolate cyclo-ligase